MAAIAFLLVASTSVEGHRAIVNSARAQCLVPHNLLHLAQPRITTWRRP